MGKQWVRLRSLLSMCRCLFSSHLAASGAAEGLGGALWALCRMITRSQLARLTLKDIKACIQLCTDAEDASVLLRQTWLAPIICQDAAWHHQAWLWNSQIKLSHADDIDCLHVIAISAGIVGRL